MQDHQKVDAVLKVLDYTKTDKKWYDEKQLVAGYHSVSIQGEKYKGQRDPDRRLAKIGYDFTERRVLDVGCANGGMLHCLSSKIKFGVGLDFNSKCINAANALKAVNGVDNIHFFAFDLDKENLAMVRQFLLGEPVDICFFLNLSLWVKRWKEAFSECAALTKTMVFEAHGSHEQQDGQIDFVKCIYQNLKLISEQSDDDPTYASRKMYLCEYRRESKPAPSELAKATFLTDGSKAGVIHAFENSFPTERVKDIKIYPETQESLVAEINDQYIVKFPRPIRGMTGITTEQAVTDLIRIKVAVQIPAITVQVNPIALARYQKIPGCTFDKTRYQDLQEVNKQALANDCASFLFALHSIPNREIEHHNLRLTPSWQISCVLIENQLASNQEPSIKALLKDTVKKHKALQIPDAHQIFSHFDLHGGNVLVNEQNGKLLGVIDFGNCKIGDLHQDLSVMNLSSTDLAERIVQCYEKISGRQVDRPTVRHYTSVFYLNLLAGLKRNKDDKKYKYWLSEFNQWYKHLLDDSARQRLQNREPLSSIPDRWRQWLVSNLIKGYASETLQNVLRQQGFSEVDIASELIQGKEHPYTAAGQEIFQTLAKRNWLLKTYNSLSALDPRYSTQIEVRKTPDFETFVKEYYSKQLPVLLTRGIDHWPALRKWSPEYFIDHFGNAEIEVQHGRDGDPQYERNSVRHKTRMHMKKFAEMVLTTEETNNFYMTANNAKNSFSSIEKLFNDVSDFGEGYRQKDTIKSGNLLWFGPKGVFTPIHHDLTNNMVVQIYGKKKVTLIPAFQVPWLYNDVGVYSATNFPKIDENRYPLLKKATPVEFFLHPGEALFIPIGWWHCVLGLDISITISFTNFNATNSFGQDYPH